MKEYFGKCNDRDVYLYTIENDILKVQVSTLGATLVSFIYKPYDRDVVLGYENAETYLDSHGSNMGATIGRCANRIAKGEFTLNDVTYHLTINNGPNTLHSGINNLTSKIYDVEEFENSLILSTVSEDGSDGFPGNLSVKIYYRLDHDTLEYRYEATSDKDTLCNITNHAYFDLDGLDSDSILDHEVKIASDHIALVDQDGLSTDVILAVKNTAFDFSDFRKIRDNLSIGHDNIALVKGYDHNYLFPYDNDDLRVQMRNGDMMLTVRSDLPGMHFYTANYLDGEVRGKKGNYYKEKNGACFECQYYPNAINYNGFKKPILKAGDTMSHYIRFTLSPRQ